MRPLRLFTLLGLVPFLTLPAAPGSDLTGSSPSGKPPQVKPADKPRESGCGRFGTQVEFVGSPAEAARRALKEQKLVFVLHVSGNFEDPRFT